MDLSAAINLLSPFLLEHYRSIKARHPGEGRRRWRLRVAETFWGLPVEQKNAYLAAISQNLPSIEAIEDAEFTVDDDPLDDESDDAPGLGVLIRTDFTNDGAWQAFHTRLQEAEAEFASDAAGEAMGQDNDVAQVSGPSTSSATSSAAMEDDREGDDEDEDEEGIECLSSTPIFHVVNPVDPEARATLASISNLKALRLLNDVGVRRAPAPPQGTKRIKPPNRLVDHDGWQETYAGKTLWIYDAQSNTDQCVRLVSQTGTSMYGTATGDSWRARVSHICELQVNLAMGAMTIDFGGLDRWDYVERARNLEEAIQPLDPQ
ncbi:uncharacterized protein BXZ73DRAFT_90167 [Epithele typhae]|uniref:uncharacterized protein n=1 Tax=Epithele typhae TaxID=378194 RepID=UPI002007B5EA|nr:uncharacterized protein BXZ73DRAFT_90167 [Epithele typhae]KAH9931081.1 hypothetical protein BXZ73DRAFT_90167 [Epithele typhae]